MPAYLLTRERIVSQALRYEGVPFKHAGRAMDGLDCGGMIVCTARGLGYPVLDVPLGYSKAPQDLTPFLEASFTLKMRRASHGVPAVASTESTDILKCMEPGDLGLFWWDPNTRCPQHVGIFLSPTTLLHAYSGVDKVSRHGFSPRWQRQLVAVYTWRTL